MESTERKAKRGMTKFVAALLMIGLGIAGIYLVYWAPGDTNDPHQSTPVTQPE